MSADGLGPAPAGVFSDAHTKSNLKSLVLRGGAIKMGSQLIRFTLRVGGLLIMARLLGPQDFGVFAMIATFTGFLDMFNSINLMMPTIQKEEITHDQVSVIFWVSLGLGVLFTSITAAAGPLLAWFYGDPRLVKIALGMAPMFLLRGLARQHQALLQRRLKLMTIETIHVTSQVSGAAAMIGSAWYGLGYWSLVFNVLASSGVEAVLFWATSGWRPGLPKRGSGARKMLDFGGNLSVYEVSTWAQGSLDQVLVGQSFGAQAVGFYAKAIGLITLSFTQLVFPISSVVVPALSRLQTEAQRYRVYYARMLGATLFLTMALVAFLSVDARQVVLTALGAKWLPVVPIFLSLVPAAAASTLTVLYTWACLSLGHGRRLSRATVAMAVASCAAYLAGLRWGPIGVARAYSAVYCLMIVPVLSYGLAESPISLSDVRDIAWRPASAAAGAALACAFIEPFWFHAPLPAVQLACDGALFGLAYLGIWALLPGGFKFLSELTSSARSIR